MKIKNYKEKLLDINTFIFDVDGVLTDGKVLVTTDGEMYRSVNTKDGYAIKLAIEKGFKIIIISGGLNEGVKKRFKSLGVIDIYLGAENKIEIFNQIIKHTKIDINRIVYMGDDIPDLEVMKKVGLSCCPSDAAPEIKDISDYISYKKGGKGCVRDIIEQTLRVQNKWNNNFN